MGELVAHVEGRIVGGAGLPHFPDDCQPALAKTAQGLGMGHATLAQGGIINRGPCGLGAAFVRKDVHRMAQVFVATAADVDLVDFAGLVVDWRCAGHALEALRVLIERPVAADLAEQARCELGPGSGQRLAGLVCEEVPYP